MTADTGASSAGAALLIASIVMGGGMLYRLGGLVVEDPRVRTFVARAGVAAVASRSAGSSDPATRRNPFARMTDLLTMEAGAPIARSQSIVSCGAW